MKVWITLGLISLGLYLYSLKAAIIFSVVTILYILNDIGLFKSAQLGKGYFRGCNIYYQEYTGNYTKIGDMFSELSKHNEQIQSKATIAIYYDNPNDMKDPNLCRAVCGLISKTQLSEENLNKLGLKHAVLPDTECIQWYFKMKFKVLPLMLIGIKKFYGSMETLCKDTSVQKIFGLDITKPLYSVEVYDDKTINFYIPLKNHDKLFLHSEQQSLEKNKNQ